MSRRLNAAVAQLGPIHLAGQPRRDVVKRLMATMREAHGRGARFVVFPELALTTFFPRWWMTDQAEIDRYFERDMPNAATRPLFDLARELGVGFYLGYAELTEEKGEARHYNTSILVERDGRDRRTLSQDPSAGPFRASAGRPVPASRKALFRRRQRGLQSLACLRRGHWYVHLQRPALARDLARHGFAGS